MTVDEGYTLERVKSGDFIDRLPCNADPDYLGHAQVCKMDRSVAVCASGIEDPLPRGERQLAIISLNVDTIIGVE